MPLLSRCQGIDRFVVAGETISFEAEAPLMSLPRAFKTTLETIPNDVPYLFADPKLIEQWRAKLPVGTFNVGIAWQGSVKYKHDKRRSIPLAQFSQLASVRGVQLISLQKGHGTDQIAGAKDHVPLLGLEPTLDESTGAFMDTAAVMMSLDLIISPDTAIAHLAGGLGVPVWVALSHVPDWRWLRDRADSPWYPTMRLFRQNKWGDWDDVFERMAAELSEQVRLKRDTTSPEADGTSRPHKPQRDQSEPKAGNADRVLNVGVRSDSIRELIARATAHWQASENSAASNLCHQVLAVDHGHPDAVHLLGVIAAQKREFDAAIKYIRQAIARHGTEARFHNSLGIVLKLQGKLDEAVCSYRRALELRPDFAETHYNLGRIFKQQGSLNEAVAYYRHAVELEPDYVEAYNSLGAAFDELGKPDEAAVAYLRALTLRPDRAETHNNLGIVLKAQGRMEDAIASYRRALALKPDFTAAFSNLLYALSFHERYDAKAICEEHRRFESQCAEPLAKFIRPHTNSHAPERRLRIGYVSPDFRKHCQSLFTVPLFSAHDHRHFEIYCYADVNRPDDMTQRLRSYADVWRDINGFTDERIAELVRQDQIDILVDLTMHMANGRPLLFARKPAPVQVCWLAYPGTTGLSAVDYRLTDPYLDPPATSESCYAEQSVHLPKTFWCYEPFSSKPEINSLPALQSSCISFGSLNNFCKVNEFVLALWAKVLNAVPGSRLVLLAPEGSCRQRILDFLSKHGVTADRLTFFGKQPLQQYLELYHGIDIGLDTFPYNGHTTSLDAYWMGVPMVTLVGQTVVGRAGLSQLTNLGLTELVAQTPDQFVEIATRLANDLPRLSQLRATLRERMRHSPLLDAAGFARGIESAYRTMWRRWCASEA